MITIAAMLLFSSVVIDVGQVMLARRQDQSAADAAALAGVPERYNETALIATVVEMLNLNIPRANFDASSLDTCAPETLPAGWSYYPNANCLARDAYWGTIRVRVPTRVVTPAFAQLAGINEFEHSAFAEAQADRTALVFPFAVPPSSAGHQCLKSGPSNVPDPACSGAASGSFGDLEFTAFGNPAFGTSNQCNSLNAIYEQNIAQGLDHNLSLYTGIEITDSTGCSNPEGFPRPNSVSPGTGNKPDRVADGMLETSTYGDGGPGRLRRTSSLPTFSTTTISGSPADDTPLWEFIPGTLPSPSGAVVGGFDLTDNVPRACYKNQFVGDRGGLNPDNDSAMSALPSSVANYFWTQEQLGNISVEDRLIKLMVRCFDHYQGNQWTDNGNFTGVDWAVGSGCTGACSDPVFTVDSEQESPDLFDIQWSPRFGYAPEILASETIGSDPVHFAAFRPVFLQRLYFGSSSFFDPGFSHSPTGNLSKVHAMTSFVIPAPMLPNGLGADDAAGKYGTTEFPVLTR